MLTSYNTRIIGRKGIAQRLSVHPATVTRWIAGAGLPAYRVGSRLEADPGALAAWRDRCPATERNQAQPGATGRT